jgi:hypothetical protein
MLGAAKVATFAKLAALPAPTYAVAAAGGATSVNEGSSLTFNVTGTNIVNGTYYFTVTNSGDFGTSSGSFTITSNAGSFSVTPTADVTTEGAETFTASVRTGSTGGTIVATSASITINDTSTTPTPTYSVTPSAGSVIETQTVTFNVTGTNITNGTYYYSLEQSAGTIVAADFNPASLTGSFTITSNAGSIAITIATGIAYEPTDAFFMNIRTGSTSGTIVATSSAVTIVDKRETYTYTTNGSWPQRSSTSSKFGGFSADFGGSNLASGRIISASSSTSSFMGSDSYTGNWTIEYWVANQSGSLAGGSYHFDMTTNGVNQGIFLYTNSTNRIIVGKTGSGSGASAYWEVNTNVNLGSGSLTWKHIALVRNGSNIHLYVDGAQTLVKSSVVDSYYHRRIIIGNNYLAGASATGTGYLSYMDEFRISPIARYTAAFTPPTAAFTNDANTTLLMHFDTTPFTDSNTI